MRFGIRECANMVFRAKQKTKIGSATFSVGQPVLYIDTAKTSSLAQESTTVYATGGRGNAQLIAWEGDKKLTWTVEDALLSPIGFAMLSGAGLFKGADNETKKVHYHMTTMATMTDEGKIDLTDALAEFGSVTTPGANEGDPAVVTPNATICLDDAPIFIMETEKDGSLTGKKVSGTVTKQGAVLTVAGVTTSQNVMVDYYIDLPGKQVYEADITADTFAGYYYVEADTLFRDQSTGKDMPANLTFPNVKLQSNFTIQMSGSGDPSTFTFTMDCFPGFTYFDKTKKVLCVLQVVGDTEAKAVEMKPVMLHKDVHGSGAGASEEDDEWGNF